MDCIFKNNFFFLNISNQFLLIESTTKRQIDINIEKGVTTQVCDGRQDTSIVIVLVPGA